MYAVVLSFFAFLFTFFASSGVGGVVQYRYDVIRSGKLVGHMVCNKYEKDGVVLFTNEVDVHISILMDIDIHNKVEGMYADGFLLKGSMERIVNGKPKKNNQIIWKTDKYLIDGNGTHTELNAKIAFTTVCLMYMEPEKIERVYSEGFRQYVSLKKIALHKYALQLPDGDYNYYTYKDGRCIELEVPTTFSTIFIRPSSK
ncbi:MAG: hypothetical protein QM802_22215 [Agriterribacter sp.]